jgi:hypothetical protein
VLDLGFIEPVERLEKGGLVLWKEGEFGLGEGLRDEGGVLLRKRRTEEEERGADFALSQKARDRWSEAKRTDPDLRATSEHQEREKWLVELRKDAKIKRGFLATTNLVPVIIKPSRPIQRKSSTFSLCSFMTGVLERTQGKMRDRIRLDGFNLRKSKVSQDSLG